MECFDGDTYDHGKDGPRLNSQFERTCYTMQDGEWHTLKGIAALHLARDGATDSEAAISARIRDLRKERFGGHTVERRRVSGGLWEYRLV